MLFDVLGSLIIWMHRWIRGSMDKLNEGEKLACIVGVLMDRFYVMLGSGMHRYIYLCANT